MRDRLPIDVPSALHFDDRAIDGILQLNEASQVPEVLEEVAFRPGDPELGLHSSGGRHVVHVHANLIGDVVR